MNRCLVRFGLAISCGALTLLAGAGCGSSGNRRAPDVADGDPSFHDRFFNDWDEPAATAPSEGDASAERGLRRFFSNDRRPGGLSPEARAIESDGFNIY